MIMQVLHAGQYGPDNRDSISLGKATALANSFKEFSADCELEGKIICRPRLEPLVKFDLFLQEDASNYDACQIALGEEGKRGETHDVGMIEALEDPHLAPHALLIALDLLLRDGLQGNLASDVLRH